MRPGARLMSCPGPRPVPGWWAGGPVRGLVRAGCTPLSAFPYVPLLPPFCPPFWAHFRMDARSWRHGVKKMCGADGGRVMRLSGALAVPYGFCR